MPSTSGSFSPESLPDTSGRKTRKPDNTAFKQQRLPAWQPILTASSVLPAFFIISLVFIPIGVVLLLASNEIIEYSQDYTSCGDCADLRSNSSTASMAVPCECSFNLEVAQDMNGEVFVYYGLSNFFQNHRRYVRSRDDVQLNGKSVGPSSINSDCAPYDKPNSSATVIYAPAGAIANSLFNDTFSISGTSGTLNISLTGIAWPTDKNVKFNNPASFANTIKPAYWQRNVSELDPLNPDNNGYENEGLIVWMRTAAFPTFRKPYGRITNGVPAGTYAITVSYNYPVTTFSGTKRFILTTTSWIGGKNMFLGIAYIVVGSLCFITAIALCVVHNITKKKATTAPR